MTKDLETTSPFLFYTSDDGAVKVQVILGDETVWATQKTMAEIFGVETNTITYHIKEVFMMGELEQDATTRKVRVVQNEAGRKVNRDIVFYNLDMIISVGYRINSGNATKFRIWATTILKEYLIKGFALDDDRLKQGTTMFGKDYFDELLERIKEIRASERRFYQKVTDIYSQCSIDYDKDSPITIMFFKIVQNKLEFAITHNTAPEIIQSRASHLKPHMGLQTWKKSPDGKVLKSDVTIAKNYLNEKEIGDLNHIVNMYLDYAELQARNNNAMKMEDWVYKLDAFLQFNEYELLNNAGNVKSKIAKAFAVKEYKKFRKIQDKEFKSDFDKVIGIIKETGQLPSSEQTESEEKTSEFNKNLKKALDYSPNDNK